MSAAERKAKFDKVRRLLAAQGLTLETFSQHSGVTSFDIILPPPPSLREIDPSEPSFHEPMPAVTAKVDWASMFFHSLNHYAPHVLQEAIARQLATVPETAGLAAAVIDEAYRRRERGVIRTNYAHNHMLIFAPEIFLAATKLLIASGRAWAAMEVDCDEKAAADIVSAALGEVTREFNDRIGLHTSGRRPAFTKPQLFDALSSLYEEGAVRPYTRAVVVERLREQGVEVTDRTLSEYAAATVCGSWDALVASWVAEFDHLAALGDEELDRQIEELDGPPN